MNSREFHHQDSAFEVEAKLNYVASVERMKEAVERLKEEQEDYRRVVDEKLESERMNREVLEERIHELKSDLERERMVAAEEKARAEEAAAKLVVIQNENKWVHTQYARLEKDIQRLRETQRNLDESTRVKQLLREIKRRDSYVAEFATMLNK